MRIVAFFFYFLQGINAPQMVPPEYLDKPVPLTDMKDDIMVQGNFALSVRNHSFNVVVVVVVVCFFPSFSFFFYIDSRREVGRALTNDIIVLRRVAQIFNLIILLHECLRTSQIHQPT